MTSYSKPKKWNGWAGTLDEIVQAAELAREVVGQWCANPDEVRVQVDMKLGDLGTESDSLDVIKNLSNADRRQLNRLRVRVSGGNAWKEPLVNIDLDNSSPALSVEVRGNDRTGVEGLATRLVDHLKVGSRRPGWYQRFMSGGLLILPILLPALGLTVAHAAGLASTDGKWQPAEIFGLIIGGVIGLVVVASVWFLTPDLQLLATKNDKTRFGRFRTAVWAATGAILASIIGTVLIGRASGR